MRVQYTGWCLVHWRAIWSTLGGGGGEYMLSWNKLGVFNTLEGYPDYIGRAIQSTLGDIMGTLEGSVHWGLSRVHWGVPVH